MKNTKKLLLGIICCLTLTPLFCEAVPVWYKNLEKEFPIEKYIRATGSGSTEKKARTEAVSNIALSFKTNVKVLNSAISDLQNSVENDKTEYSQKDNLHKEFSAETEAEFYCLQFTNSYYDKKQKKYFVAAYIDREAAYSVYKSKIDPLVTEMYSTWYGSKEEEESLYRCFLLHKASLLGVMIRTYVDNAVIICPSMYDSFDGVLYQIGIINSEIETQKNNISFSVECKEPKGQNLIHGVASILEEAGFVYTTANATYKIKIEIQFTEEVYEAGEFVRPSVSIMISNKNGVPVDSYSKVYPRYTHGSMENSYNLAVLRVQQDLEENFMSSYRSVFPEE